MKKEFKLGGKNIFPNLFLSPMHGVSDGAFRRTIQRLAGGRIPLFVSEFVSVEQIKMRVQRDLQMMEHSSTEKQFGIQIFGYDIENMVHGALVAQNEFGADFVEINCGCPAPNVVRRGGGSALLKELPHLKNILKEIKPALNVPLTLKARLGWDSEQINIQETLNIAQGEGVDLFVIHGRTRVQGYKGFADWDTIAEAAQKAHIPVIGNGDILTVEDVQKRLKTYDLDGVSIGRGAMHNPWIFDQWANILEGKTYQSPTHADQIHFFEIYLDELKNMGYFGVGIMGRLKQIAARLFKCFTHSQMGELRATLLRTQSEQEFWDTLKKFHSLAEQTGEMMVFHAEPVQNLNGKSQNEVIDGQDYKR